MLANRRPSRGWVTPFANITLKILKRWWWWWWWPGWLLALLTWVIEGSRKGITLPRNVRTLEKEKSRDLSLRREAGKRSSFFLFFFPPSYERTTMGRKWERKINGHLFNKLPRSSQDTWCHVLCLTVTSRIVCRGGIRLSPNWGALISARDSASSERQMLRLLFFLFFFPRVRCKPSLDQ